MLKQTLGHPTSVFIIALCTIILTSGLSTVAATAQTVYVTSLEPNEIEQRNSEVLTVDDNGSANYTKIQSAIDNASAGDTVYVNTGIYYEKVTLNKPIKLIGEDREKTVICNPSLIVYVNTTEATIKNFTITGGEISVYLYNTNNINISNCRVSYATKHGIYFRESSKNTITNVEALLNTEDGFRLDYSSCHNTILGCSVSQNGLNGVSIFQSSQNNTISNTNISSNGVYGLFISNSSFNTISNSDLSKNKHGIYLSNSSHNFIANSTVQFSDYVGMGISFSSSNIITNCTLADNYVGFHLSDSTSNLIFHNNFINNTYQAFDLEGNNSWDNGVEGNYWSDYAGGDANGDGAGDTPYIIDLDSRDNFPLVTSFNGADKQQITTVKEKNNGYLLAIAIFSVVIILGIIIFWQKIMKKVKQKRR